MGEQHDGVVVAGAELHPPAGPRIQVDPLRDESRLPVARRRRDQYHPAALRGLLYRREARSRHHPRRDSRNSKLRRPHQRPGPGRRDATHRSALHAAPVPAPARLRGRPATRQSWTPRRRQRCPRKRGRHAIWCPVSTTNACMALVPLTVGRDRANISDKSVAPFARTRSHYLKLNTAGPPHREMPLLGAQYMDSLDGTRA